MSTGVAGFASPPSEPARGTETDSAESAAGIARGVCRLFSDLGAAGLCEFSLPNGRRVDVAALTRTGEIWFAEIKSSVADFRADSKWPEYRPFCDRLFFAVAESFPQALLPEECGLIIADRYGGALLREAPMHRLSPARRRALTLRFARVAAFRLARQGEPPAEE